MKYEGDFLLLLDMSKHLPLLRRPELLAKKLKRSVVYVWLLAVVFIPFEEKKKFLPPPFKKTCEN